MAKRGYGDMLDMLAAAVEDPSQQLPEAESRHLLRLKDTYNYWLAHPVYSEARIRDYIMASYRLGRSQAYADISIIKALFGVVPRAEKEFQRFRANKILEMATAAALAGNDSKAKALTKIADSIAKVNHLDTEEGDQLPWEEIKPVDISISVDPSVIGITPEPDAQKKAKALLERYTKEIDPDAEIPQ